MDSVRGDCRDAGESRAENSILSKLLANPASRIVEYATQDQAQTAVNTLSNQNLMGRLVYVREVSQSILSHTINELTHEHSRTARPSHASSKLPVATAADSQAATAHHAAADTAAAEATVVAAWACKVVAEAVGRSTSPTFVLFLVLACVVC